MICKSNGISQEDGNYRLRSGATSIAATSALTSLGPFADRVSVIGGMTYGHMKRANFGCHLAHPFVLSAKSATLTSGRWDGTGTSYYESTASETLDRFLAKRLGTTPVQALAIREKADKDPNLAISYESGPVAGRSNPAATADSPARVWETLFGGASIQVRSPEQDKRRAIEGAVATRLHEAYERYRGRMAGWERAEVENQLQAVEAWRAKTQVTVSESVCQRPPVAKGESTETAAEFDIVADMLVSAMKCGITNVASFLWSGGGWTLPANGQGPAARGGTSDEHGDVGHSGNEAVRRAVDQWYIDRYASLLKKLDAVPEGNGTMLDNSIVVFADRDPDHNSHTINDLAWIVAGRGGGKLLTGQSIRWPAGEERKFMPHARLLATLCAAMKVDPKDFTDAEPLTQLLG